MSLKKFTDFLEKYFVPIAMKVGENRYLQSIRDGILLTMPFIMVGSVFLILTNLPIPGFSEFMQSIFGEAWKTNFSYPVRVTFDLMALFAAAGISYSLANKYKIDPLITALTSIAAFILATPLEITQGSETVSRALSLTYTSSRGLFVAIIVSIWVTEIFKFATNKNLIIKMPESVPPSVARSFSAMIPGGMAITTIWVMKTLLLNTDFNNLHNFVQVIVGKPLSVLSGSLIGLLIAIVIQQLLWAVGLHGSSIVMAVMRPPLMVLLDENRAAMELGQELPHVINMSFYELWVQVGGSGTTLGLALSLLFVVKSKQLKELGKLAFIPSLFNINEPLSFGMPIVMNPLLMIPWVIAPVITTTLAYFAMASGLVAKTTGILLPWTTPSVISGFLATNHISGALLQVFIITASGLIYYPFLKLWDSKKVEEEKLSETEDLESVEAEIKTI